MNTKRYILGISIFLLFILQCQSLSADIPDELFSEALKQAELGKQKDETSYEEAYVNYAEASKKIEEIMLKFSGTEIAKELNNGDLKIIGLSYKEFNENFLTLTKRKADAEVSFLECARFMVESCENSAEKIKFIRQIANNYASNNKKNDALLLLEQALALKYQNEIIRKNAFAEIIRGFTEIGEYTRAVKLIKESGISGEITQSALYAYMAACYIKENKYDDAIKLADSLDSPLTKSLTMAEIGNGYAIANNKEKAREFLVKSKNLMGKDVRDDIMIKLGQGFAIMGDFSNAMAIALNSSEIWKYYIFSEIAITYLRGGNEKEYLEYLNMIDNVSVKDLLWSLSAEYYASKQQYEESVNAINAIKQSSLAKDTAYFALAKEYLKNGDFEKASDLLKSIFEPKMKILFMAAISCAYFDINNKQDALHMLNNLLIAIQELEDIADRISALLVVIEKYPQLSEKLDTKSKQILHNILKNTSQRKQHGH